MSNIDEIQEEILKTIDHAFDLGIFDGDILPVDLPFADYIEPIGMSWLEVWLDDEPVTEDLSIEQWQEMYNKVLKSAGMA